MVRQVFEWVGQERLSIGEVCRRLARQGVPSPRGKSYWDRTSVWAVLKNPAYKGSAAFGKTRVGPRRARLRAYRGQAEQPRRPYGTYDLPEEEWIRVPVPALVSEELFNAVNEQLAENRSRRRQTKRGASHLLQGLLVCQRCGHALYGKSLSLRAGKGRRRDYAYYRCIGMDAYRFGGQRLCGNRQVRTDLLEDAVWQDVRALLREPQRIEREYQRRLEDPKASTGGHAELPTMIQRVERGIARLIDAYQDGLLERPDFESRIQRARERLDKLRTEAKMQAELVSQEEQLRLVIGCLQDFAGRIQEGLEDADWTTRREIIRAVVKRVEVGLEDVRVVYRVNPAPFVEGPERGRMQHCWRGDLAAARQPLHAPLRAGLEDAGP